jgi:MFS family permease
MSSEASVAHDSGLAWKLLKVRRGEGPKVLAFVGLATLLQTGIAIGLTAADALFIANVGVQGLPAVYMLVPLLMLVYVPLTGWLLGRFGVHRTLQGTLLVLVLGGGAFFVVLSRAGGVAQGPSPGLIYYGAKLYASLWYIGLYSLYWNFADAYFDLQDAKRLFALFSAGSALGSIAGGAMVASATSPEQLRMLYLVWAGCAMATLPVVSAIVRRFRHLDDWLPDEGLSFAEQLSATRQAFRQSALVRALMLSLVMSLLLTTIAEYQYLGIFSKDRSEVELAALIGGLFALVNAFNLLVTLFIFSRLVLKLGVTQVALIQPAVYLIAFLVLLLQGGLPAAVFGFFAYQGVLTSIDYNNQNFLFRAVPARVKKQVRTAIEGFAEPLATALGGALLFVLRDRISPLGLSALGVVGALGYLAVVLRLRAHYVPAIVRNLREGWLDLAQDPSERLQELDADEVARIRGVADVQTEASGSSDSSAARSALSLLWLRDPERAVDLTLDHFEQTPAAQQSIEVSWIPQLTRHANPAQHRRLAKWARDRRAELPSSLLLALAAAGILDPGEPGALDGLSKADARSLAIIGLWREARAGARTDAKARLHELLSGGPDEIRQALRVIAALGDQELVPAAARVLANPSTHLRSEALAALARSTAEASDAIGRRLLRIVREVEGHEQELALTALGRIRDPEGVASLLRAAEGFGPARRRQALRVLLALGPASVPGAVRVLRDLEAPRSSRLLAARVLADTALAQLMAISGELVERELSRARAVRRSVRLLRRAGADAADDERAGLEVLARVLEDQQANMVDFVLEVLSLEGHLPDFDLLAASLRSGIPRERANALETIEEGVPAQLFEELSDLLDDGQGALASAGARLRRAHRSGLAADRDRSGAEARRDLESLLHDALQSGDALEAAAAAFTLLRRDSARYVGVVADRLGHMPNPLFRDTVLALAGGDTGPAEATPIEVLAALVRAPAFARFPIAELQALVPEVTRIRGQGVEGSGDPQPGATGPILVLVLEGWVEFSDGRRAERGDLIGLEAVFRDAPELRVRSAQGDRLEIAVDAVQARCRASSRVAIELVTHLTEAGHVTGV